MQRSELFQNWVTQSLGIAPSSLTQLDGDAGFRVYYRVMYQDNPIIVVDARLPAHENQAFVAVGRAFKQQGLAVPEIIIADEQQGFFALKDFGQAHYLDELSATTADHLYQDAMQALLKIQQVHPVQDFELPQFDAVFMRREFTLFTEWYLGNYLQLKLTNIQQALLENVFNKIVTAILAQPIVSVHRDYHSRNLMVIGENNPGILDFQDAVRGPVTYDLVSLLRDCYISWPEHKVDQWTTDFYQQLPAAITTKTSAQQFFIWRDWMGVQRHLKAIGIFARLSLRDGKTRYLQDIPRTFEHLLLESSNLPELAEFRSFLIQEVLPISGDSKLCEQ